MKKIVVFGLFVILFLSSVQTTYANSGPPIRGIEVRPSECTEDYIDEEFVVEYPGNFDILVKESEFDFDAFGPMTELYQSRYPFYEDVAYLDNLEEGWTSYTAYYQDDNHVRNSDYYCAISFGSSELVSQISRLKLVYFDDEGNTLFISEEIKVPSVYFFQDRDAIIYFDTETLEIDPSLDPHMNPYLIMIVLFIVGFIIFSIVIELIVALAFRLTTKKALLNVLLINLITQGLMYIYFLGVFDAYQSAYMVQLLIAEAIIVAVEFAYLYWRLKPTFTWKHLGFYVIVSNIISYLLGILRYY